VTDTPLDLDAVLTRYYDADPYGGTGVIAALDDIPALVAALRKAEAQVAAVLALADRWAEVRPYDPEADLRAAVDGAS
jgi:hypothetical protein